MSRARSSLSRSPAQTRELGRLLGELLQGGDVLALTGPLGAGKTCLVQGLAEGLGIDPRAPVTSPSFGIVAEYPGRVWLRHADFYRVESYARLLDAGFDDLCDASGVLVVEWPERFPEVVPAERLEIRIEPGADPEARLLRVEARGERAGKLREELDSRWP
ncbi:MAG: tRNA (adenosine(37)-N6)-threonylcarbamoyltransferase complex ATPase subunit type 1 TsaE [Myxococcota bacterium]